MAKTTLPTPLYAVAGAGDVVAEQLKKLAANAPELQTQIQKTVADLPADLRKLSKEIPGELQSFAADVPSYAAQARTKARDLDADQVRITVRKNVETASARALDVYSTLVARGKKVVDREPGTLIVTPTPTPEPEPEANAVAKKTAARTTAKKVATKSATRPGKES
ncbi:MAG TPA: hypothetical protein VGR21_05890 [Cryptosporangiaceae bacterium]|nr:hypothetical protein [Cryptosporangiaceae bacterium]